MDSESFDLSIKTLKGEMFQVNVNSSDSVRIPLPNNMLPRLRK